MEALVAATGINARILKLDRIGTVAARKEAAFVVLDANPLDDILNTRRISAVYLRGEALDRTKLRADLQRVSGVNR
jgi:imidazolonepropionase-like amidohydrolase